MSKILTAPIRLPVNISLEFTKMQVVRVQLSAFSIDRSGVKLFEERTCKQPSSPTDAMSFPKIEIEVQDASSPVGYLCKTLDLDFNSKVSMSALVRDRMLIVPKKMCLEIEDVLLAITYRQKKIQQLYPGLRTPILLYLQGKLLWNYT